jgi:hypothetical protein
MMLTCKGLEGVIGCKPPVLVSRFGTTECLFSALTFAIDHRGIYYDNNDIDQMQLITSLDYNRTSKCSMQVNGRSGNARAFLLQSGLFDTMHPLCAERSFPS